MYVALAARPLPKWFHLILSILLFNLSCATIYVYIMTRNITTSTQRFEALPAYIVSILFFASGCLSLSMTKSVINENIRVAQLGVVLSLVTIVVSMTAVICTLWLADKQDKFVVCVYNVQHSQCMCRNDNITNAQDDNWYSYEDITGCNRLDTLNRCMIASIALDAVGAFVCFLALSNFGLIWARKKSDQRAASIQHDQQITRDVTTPGSGSLSVGVNSANGPSSIPSPVITPGAHSDWDGWLFSHPIFRQLFSEFRHVWFPPSYEESQLTSSPGSGRTTGAPDRPMSICTVNQADPSITITATPTRTYADYPPPPYSKAKRTSSRSSNERKNQVAISSVQMTNASTSTGIMESRLTTSRQSCV